MRGSPVLTDRPTDADPVELAAVLWPQIDAIRRRHQLDAEAGRDILQNSLVRLIQNKDSIRNAPAWLLTVYRNECLRHLRQAHQGKVQRVDPGALDTLHGVETPALQKVFLTQVGRAIARLPRRDRIAIEGRYLRGLRPEEIADELGVRPSSVKNAVSRALALLRKLLAVE